MTMATPSNWTDAEYAEAVRLWAEGLSISAIGAAIGRTRGSIIGAADRNRPDFPARTPQSGFRRARDWTPEQDAEMTRLRMEHGHTWAAIGKALGKSRDAVESRASRIGLLMATKGFGIRETTPRARPWTDHERAEVRRMRLLGMSNREIGLAVGRHEETVARMVRSLGLGMTATERSLANSRAARGGGLPKVAAPLPTIAPLPILNPVPYPPAAFRCRAPAWPDDMPVAAIRDHARDGRLMCCGQPVKAGSPYCGAHHARFYSRVTPAGKRVRITRPARTTPEGAIAPA